MAEPHDAPAGGHLGLDPRFGPRRIADGVEGVEGPPGGAAVQRAGQRAERGTDDVGEIGTRRGDDPRRERRRVEAVVDREDEVLLERPGCPAVGASPVTIRR